MFKADRGYDADANFRWIFELLMFPNINQSEHLKEGPKEERSLQLDGI
jgi:hypothetical protein